MYTSNAMDQGPGKINADKTFIQYRSGYIKRVKIATVHLCIWCDKPFYKKDEMWYMIGGSRYNYWCIECYDEMEKVGTFEGKNIWFYTDDVEYKLRLNRLYGRARFCRD